MEIHFYEYVEENSDNAERDRHVVPYRVYQYVRLTPGIPGNILSAIVWLRPHKKNSSAVYLAALAINDTAFLLCEFSVHEIRFES